jgi:PTS system mannose-specific IIA component
MVGIVLCCHGAMGAGMRDAAEMIVGPTAQLAVVGVFPGDGRERVIAALVEAVREVDRGHGVLVLADLPGGTPWNLLTTAFGDGGLELVAGINLPALLKALTGREAAADAASLAREVTEYGGRHLVRGADPPRQGGADRGDGR